jgi:hypothetical protein
VATVVYIKVVPQSGRNEWKLGKSGHITCYLKSAPEKGLANKELIQLLAKQLKLTQIDIAIVSGATSRLKRVSIAVDLTVDELLIKLGIHRQMGMFDIKE